jgi:hypothetical protein
MERPAPPKAPVNNAVSKDIGLILNMKKCGRPPRK